MKAPPSARLLQDLVRDLSHLNGCLLAVQDRLARAAGQTSARCQVLAVVAHEPRIVSQIAHGLGLTRQSVQRTANHLHAEGIARYVDNPAHCRNKLLQITAEGRSILLCITQRRCLWASDLTRRIDEPTLRQFLRAIRDICTALEWTEPAQPRPCPRSTTSSHARPCYKIQR